MCQNILKVYEHEVWNEICKFGRNRPTIYVAHLVVILIWQFGKLASITKFYVRQH